MSESFCDVIYSFLLKDLKKKVDVAVVGDIMFDEYYDVEVERISPEFPIPVYRSSSFDPTSGLIPGGAANVAYQFRHFNVQGKLVALINKMADVVFDAKGINTSNCKITNNIIIPTKRRIYSHNIPLVRHDIEKLNYGLDDIKKHLFELKVPESDFTIFSDYSKGLFCCPWFRKYLQQNKNIVDPKSANIDLWETCTYFKPNSHEAEYLSDRKNPQDQIEFFIDALKCDGVLVTQSGKGVVGKEKDGDGFEVRPFTQIPAPESVIGAGDCFVAFTSMALAHGFTLEQAAKIAFVAGCCYVQKRHNTPLCAAELLNYVGGKVIHEPELLQNRNFTLAFANGCFDLGLTAPHVQLFEFAKSKADKLVVAINSDASVAKLKGASRPIVPAAERAEILAACKNIDYVVIFDEDTPLEVIKKIQPEVIVKGGDYTKENVVGNNLADVEIFNLVQGMSTSDKIKKIIKHQ